MKTIYQFLLSFLFLWFVNAAVAQNITTTIGAVSGCIGDTVSVPVTINMASGISVGNITLSINYDTTKLQCLSTVTSLNSNISAGFLSICSVFFPGNPQFRAAWYNLTPVAFNGLMFNVRFVILASGSSSLIWDLSTPGNCEYGDENQETIPNTNTTWNNGTVLLSNDCFGPPTSSLCLPSIITTSSSVGMNSVVIGGNITYDGGSSIVLRGVCYSTSPNPNMGNSRTEDGSGIGSFNTFLTGLTSSTTYYARSYAKNSNGVVVYGNEVSFMTSSSLPGVRCPGTPTVTDIDGNVYNTVQIGTQCWIQSNLKVSKYRNGDNILTGLNNSQWYWPGTGQYPLGTGAYAIYNNNPVNDGLYGKLYNHFAVTDSRGLCPTGWHVPSDGEWNILVKYLDPNADTVCVHCSLSGIAGGALKSTATQPAPGGWIPPNTGATNSSGFTALPGGLRTQFGDFFDVTYNGYWWSSSFTSNRTPYNHTLYSIYSSINRTNHASFTRGLSVRCLKD